MTDPFDELWESTHGDSNNGVDTELDDDGDGIVTIDSFDDSDEL
jgi:hypothetical protein